MHNRLAAWIIRAVPRAHVVRSFSNLEINSVLVSSDELGGEAAETCSYGVEFHLLDTLIGATEKIVRSK